jgi:hypothetical protein
MDIWNSKKLYIRLLFVQRKSVGYIQVCLYINWLFIEPQIRQFVEQQVRNYVMIMASVGKLEKFEAESDDIEANVERLDSYFLANDIAEGGNGKHVLISLLGATM